MADESSSNTGEGILSDVAKAIGTAAGKVASLATPVKGKPEAAEKQKPKPPLKENAYQAEYLGSGTFKISKPKRSKAKRRQSALKAPRRGARK